MKFIHEPYTYLLHHIPTDTWYYGARWARGCKPAEFWRTYFTSSGKIHKLRAEYGDDTFEFQIRKTFKTNKQAVEWEFKVLRRMKVLQKPSIWLNRTDNKAILNEVQPSGTLGKHIHTEKTKQRLKLLGLKNKGTRKPWLSVYNKTRVNPRKGIKDSKTSERLRLGYNPGRDRKWITDGYVDKRILNYQEIPIGWRSGRTHGVHT